MIDLGVVAEFDKQCRLYVNRDKDMVLHGAELIRFAQDHERRPVILNNLSIQIQLWERKYGRTKAGTVAADKRLAIIEASAHIFMRAIKVHRDLVNQSEAEKARKKKQQQLENDVAQLIREGNDGSTPQTT